MLSLFTLALLSFSAFSSELTVIKALQRGYKIRVHISRDLGVVFPEASKTTQISDLCWLNVKAPSSRGRILSKGRKIDFVNGKQIESSGYSYTILAANDKTVSSMEVYGKLFNETISHLESKCKVKIQLLPNENLEQASELDENQFQNNV